MIQISPDGEHILSGTGGGPVVLDNKVIVEHASGWGWTAHDACAGPGGFDITKDGNLGYYNLHTGYQEAEKPFTCSAFYAWPFIWLATKNGSSWDSNGIQYTGKIALGVGTAGDLIFTDSSNVALYIKNSVGQWFTVPHPGEWTPLPSSGYFSRNYPGCYHNNVWYACGYRPEYGGMCLWTPIAGGPISLLSTQLDYNPGIGVRTRDNMLIIGSGADAAETRQKRYEINTQTREFALWQPLKTVGSQQPPATQQLEMIKDDMQ